MGFKILFEFKRMSFLRVSAVPLEFPWQVLFRKFAFPLVVLGKPGLWILGIPHIRDRWILDALKDVDVMHLVYNRYERSG